MALGEELLGVGRVLLEAVPLLHVVVVLLGLVAIAEVRTIEVGYNAEYWSLGTVLSILMRSTRSLMPEASSSIFWT